MKHVDSRTMARLLVKLQGDKDAKIAESAVKRLKAADDETMAVWLQINSAIRELMKAWSRASEPMN